MSYNVFTFMYIYLPYDCIYILKLMCVIACPSAYSAYIMSAPIVNVLPEDITVYYKNYNVHRILS